MDKPKQVHQSEVNRWLKHPVTEVLLYNLQELELYLVDACGRGGCIQGPESNISLENSYYHFQGGLHALSVLISDEDDVDLKEFMDYQALIINDVEDGE